MNSKQETQNSQPTVIPEDEAVEGWHGSWNRLYAFVIAELAVLIILFYTFTKAFE